MIFLRQIAAAVVSIGLAASAPAAFGQSAERARVSVPQFVNFAGVLKGFDGKPASGVVGVTFLLYEEEEGGSPLWLETQNVTVNASGHYSVTLGAGTPEGLPAEIFAAKQARWLAIEPQGLPAPARVMLLSVPYALKAGDAETIGGLPASAFMRANAAAPARAEEAIPQLSSALTSQVTASGTGTANYIPRWTPNGTTLGNSALFQTGAGTAAKVGINTSTPAATLDVNGGVTARGALQLPGKSAATSAKGFLSQPLILQASAFNSNTQTAVTPKFQWQAEPQANNTTNPGASLNLLYSSAGTPAETGLSIAGNGQISFAPGQTFPGTGVGSITGVSAGTGLSGGGTSGAVTLSLNTGYSDGRYAQLAANNLFSGVQIFNSAVGIGVQSPSYPLHVSGTIRSEGGLSLGGNAPVVVDAPGVVGGRLAVLANGRVGINNTNPASTLDVGGNINASGTLSGNSLSVSGTAAINGSITTNQGITTGGAVSVGGSLQIKGDTPMTSAPRMYLTTLVAGPLGAYTGVDAIVMVPSRDILITRVNSSNNPCPWAGTLDVDIYTRHQNDQKQLYDLSVGALPTDTGALALPVNGGDQLFVSLAVNENCGIFGESVTNIPIIIEYVMR